MKTQTFILSLAPASSPVNASSSMAVNFNMLQAHLFVITNVYFLFQVDI